MDSKRKDEKKELSPWALAAGIGIGVGILYGGYKLLTGSQKQKEEEARVEEEARANTWHDRPSSAISFYSNVSSDESDDGDNYYYRPSSAISFGSNVGSDDGDNYYGGPFSVCSPLPSLSVDEIGVNFNKWRIPRKLTNSELRMACGVCDASENELNIDEDKWGRASRAVDQVLAMLLKEIKTEAEKYEGLVIEQYIRQGSSREGLKIHAPDEFDVLLQYHFDNLEYQVENIRSGNSILPELAYLRVNSTMEDLVLTHPRLYRKGVFVEMNDEPYLSTMALQEKVFKSIIASASDKLETRVNDGKNRAMFGFRIKLRTNPPSVNICIELTNNDSANSAVFTRLNELSIRGQVTGFTPQSMKTVTIIDVDIVPGLLLSEETVPDPINKWRTMSCPIYAVFKWFTENHRSASRYGAKPDLLWRICSSGYEKHVLDVARGKQEQLHIINALRIMKLYFRNNKRKAIDRNEPPPQVVTVLRSYYLKHVAFYCILFLRVLNKVDIPDVEVALTYMLDFLGVCLEERRLPHFFHANKHITSMFPEFGCKPRSLRYDLFQGKRGDSLNQALLTYRKMTEKMFAIFPESAVSEKIVQGFRSYVSSGNYFE